MQEKIQKAKQKSIFWGVVGGILLLSVYFVIVSVVNSFGHAIDEFSQLWYWITALTVGFGIQVGLYAHVRQTIQLKKQAHGATSTIATAGGVSTVSMVACCAHHLTDFLPILGLSAAAAFLSAYQLIFIMLGIISNILGATYMLSIIAKHHLYFDANRWLTKLAGYNYKRIFKGEISILFTILLVGISLFQPSQVISENNNIDQQVTLEQEQVAANGIWVDVGGVYDRAESTLTLTIKFTTHSGSLDFQVDEIATLSINGHEVVLPVTWVGSPPGGHHRSGELNYEDLPADVKSITLQLSTKGRMGVRTFAWDLSKSAPSESSEHGLKTDQRSGL